jgi:HPt (histidine-containing phosphotransfer) domain-containing protein
MKVMQVNSQQLFDYASLEAELDADCAAELGRSFLEDAGGIMERLTNSMSAHDQEVTRACAHKLRGACRSINALPVESAASALEDAAGSGDWTQIDACYANARPLFEALCGEIQAYLSKS